MKQSSLSPARLAAMAARPRKSSGFTISCGLVCLGLLSPPLTAGHIIFVGTEVGGLVDSPVDANDYLVENWSNTAVPKTYDADGNNFYGSDGYYQITPSAIGTDNAVLEVGEGNDLGVTLDTTVLPEGQYPTQYLMPAFLAANPTGAAGTYYNLDTAPEYSNPAGDGLIRQGSLSVSINNSGGTVPGLVPIPGNWNNAFTFTLDEAASFRLGVAVDTLGYSDYAPDYVSVSNVNTGEVFSAPLTRDGVSDMVFFDIKGSAGDEFAVNLWQTSGQIGVPVAFGLITFDRIPVPILSFARDGGNFTLSWQPQITGWTLESSTNLAPDSWTPVTGVENNHVLVPMTGVPKKFFRLKEIP